MTTSNSTHTLAEAMQVRTQKHNEAISLMAKIEAAQNALQDHKTQFEKLNPAASYYAPVAEFHLAQIEKLTEVRNEAVCQYNRLLWALYSADLPLFSSTGIQEVSVTLYTAQTMQVALG